MSVLCNQLVFNAELTEGQVAALKHVSEIHHLHYTSQPGGSKPSLTIGVEDGAKIIVSELPGFSTPSLSVTQLTTLFKDYLNLDAADALLAADEFSQSKVGNISGATSGSINRLNSKAKSGSIRKEIDVEKWVQRTLELVEMERQAEVDQATEAVTLCSPETAQARGRALLNLRMTDMEGGLLGRTLITLVCNKGYTGSGPAPPLHPHKLGSHDVVALRPNKGPSEGQPLCSGVVYRLKDNSVVIAVDDVPEEGLDQPLRLEKLANEVTYKRLKTTLGTLSKAAMGITSTGSTVQQPTPGSVLVDVAFGKREPRYTDTCPDWKPVNTGLDDSQRQAISKALQAKDFALIHGPPGTGKTTAVVEFILQEVARGSRVLAVAASNIAVDNLVERVVAAAPKIKTLRMGHPARLLPQVLDSCLEAHVLKSDNSSLAKDCRKEIKSLNSQLLKLGPRERAERRAIRADLRRLAKEERTRQEAAVVEVVKSAQVIASTLTGLLHPNLDGQVFDVVVIDEAAQALEAACWAGLLRAPRAVLAGDHLQLPPTIISDAAAAKGLGVTLFERLQGMFGDGVSTMLTVQYRMNKQIMQWSSDALYHGKLTAHESVADHTVADLVAAVRTATPATSTPRSKTKTTGKTTGSYSKAASSSSQSKDPGLTVSSVDPESASKLPVLLLVDTAGCGFEEHQEEEGDSKANQGESKAVIAHVKRLIMSGLAPSDIGIITPYNAQVALLREMRPEKLSAIEISSVDGFQGREKEAIVISMVRSNSNGEVGFLADRRRMNVAVTRARRHVAVVADTDTVTKDIFLKGLITYFEAHGEYCSAQELVDEQDASKK